MSSKKPSAKPGMPMPKRESARPPKAGEPAAKAARDAQVPLETGLGLVAEPGVVPSPVGGVSLPVISTLSPRPPKKGVGLRPGLSRISVDFTEEYGAYLGQVAKQGYHVPLTKLIRALITEKFPPPEGVVAFEDLPRGYAPYKGVAKDA